MPDELNEVLAANAAFYSVFARLDAAAMDAELTKRTLSLG
jgi:hypothetical protein